MVSKSWTMETIVRAAYLYFAARSFSVSVAWSHCNTKLNNPSTIWMIVAGSMSWKRIRVTGSPVVSDEMGANVDVSCSG